MNAGQPWSGQYDVKTPIWATAHHTQFAQPGWTYTARGSGVDILAGGGTVVTYVSPEGGAARDWTVVLEKITHSTGPCLRDDFQNDSMATETVVFTVGPGLKSNGLIQMWVSDWSKGDATEDGDLFQPGPEVPLTLNDKGQAVFNITIRADHVVTATTLSRAAGFGRHGTTVTPPPPSAPFPAKYANDFDTLALDSDEPYLADQAGHWEVRAEGGGSSNHVLRHVCPAIGVVYRGDTNPIAVLGSPDWADLNVSLRFRMESKAAKGIYFGVRARNKGRGGDPAANPLPQGTHIAGAYIAVYLNGSTAVVNESSAVTTAGGNGRAAASDIAMNTWYNMSLSVRGSMLRWDYARSDGHADGGRGSAVLAPQDYPNVGQFGLGLVDYGMAAIDDLAISGVDGA